MSKAARRLADSSRAQVLLVWFSFLEAIIVPIPLEAVLVPYMQARRDILWRLAALALAGYMAAALLVYAVGAVAVDTVGAWALERAGWHEAYHRAVRLFERHGFWAILAVGLLPIPSQVAMLAAGALGYPLPMFGAAMFISRGIRDFGVAALAAVFGSTLPTIPSPARAWTILALVILLAALGWWWARPSP